ncbi:YggT family protein [Microbacterium radiodurans]|uniref:YggT family protein n=1 Tax=Microbacterium radiodurans TaxID=661398 RepID=A0A5J5ISB2_9MICO|nr:YggT family protein [Microbacterium radiodurans]KAA9087170.1 YggT family protein [Microbacterium radiodurans]
MDAVRLIAALVYFLLLLYILVLFIRLILEYIPLFNREWRPRGVALVLAEVVYTITDPPIKMFRRFIPPLRLGVIAIDLAFPLTMLLCFILLSVTQALASV